MENNIVAYQKIYGEYKIIDVTSNSRYYLITYIMFSLLVILGGINKINSEILTIFKVDNNIFLLFGYAFYLIISVFSLIKFHELYIKGRDVLVVIDNKGIWVITEKGKKRGIKFNELRKIETGIAKKGVIVLYGKNYKNLLISKSLPFVKEFIEISINYGIKTSIFSD